MNELQIFNNTEFGAIRAITIADDPWFAGMDVAKALGFKNTKDAIISHVDEVDRRIFQRSDFATFGNSIAEFNIPNRGITFINESGLYALIFGSKLESARRFKRWVTSEVLPSIRKTGSYRSGGPEDLRERTEYIRQLNNLIAACDGDISLVERFLFKGDKDITEEVKTPQIDEYDALELYLRNHPTQPGDRVDDVYNDYCHFCTTYHYKIRDKKALGRSIHTNLGLVSKCVWLGKYNGRVYVRE